MPSDYNHIDDFFRRKEAESAAPDHLQEQHWQQFRNSLPGSHPPTGKLSMFKIWTGGLSLAAVISTLVIIYQFIHTPDKGSASLPPQATLKPHSVEDTRAVDGLPGKKLVLVKKDTIQIRPNRLQLEKNQLKVISDTIRTLKYELKFTDQQPVVTEAMQQKAFEQFFAAQEKPADVFQVNNSRDTTVYGAEGTILFIPANSFETASGPVNGVVSVSLREFYSFDDIVGNKLTTMSSGQALVTGGMLQIKAQAGGTPVTLKKGAVLDLKMPAAKFDPQMQLFTGQDHWTPEQMPGDTGVFTASAGNINWIPSGQKQRFYAENRKYIRVWNVRNNPVEVRYKHEFNPSKSKSVGLFRIPWNSGYTTEEIKAEMEKRYGKYYDEIRVRKEWRPLFVKKRELDTSFVQVWYDSPFVGDTVTMHIATAMRLKYITRADSLRYEAMWKEELELMAKRNESYNALVQMREQYNFKISALGWINCDRFLAYPKSSLTDFAVQLQDEFRDLYFHSVLVFQKENVILQGNLNTGKIIFNNIPTGQAVTLICIGVKEGKAYTCIQDLTVTREGAKDVKFEMSSPEEFREKLKRLGTVGRRG